MRNDLNHNIEKYKVRNNIIYDHWLYKMYTDTYNWWVYVCEIIFECFEFIKFDQKSQNFNLLFNPF